MHLRGDQAVFKAAFYGVISALFISSSSLVASAADSPATTVQAASVGSDSTAGTALPNVVISSAGVVAMAPIPDSTPGAAIAVQATAPDTRPSVIIKDGVVMMAPIGDGAPAANVSAGTRSEVGCLANAVYFEARGESTRGQEAVAQVVLARAKTPGRPKTICGVVYEGSHLSTGCQFSFTCDGIADVVRNRGAWKRAQRIASRAMSGKFRSVARGATFFHARYVRPYWASHMVKVATIGTHIFYRP